MSYLSCMSSGGSNNFPDVLLQPTAVGPVSVPASNFTSNMLRPGQPHFLIGFMPGHQGTPAGSMSASSTGMPLPSAMNGSALGPSMPASKSMAVYIAGIPADNAMTANMNNMGSAQIGSNPPSQSSVEALR